MTDLQKWQIPTGYSETIIYPDSFIILWADSEPEQGVLHLGFKLSSGGENVVLTQANGTTIIDSFSFPQQTKTCRQAWILALEVRGQEGSPAVPLSALIQIDKQLDDGDLASGRVHAHGPTDNPFSLLYVMRCE